MTAQVRGQEACLILAGVGIRIAVPLECCTLQVPDALVTWLQHKSRKSFHLWMAADLRML